MKKALPEASCAPTDQACLCTDAKYTAALEECVVSSCTIRQSLSKLDITDVVGTQKLNEKKNKPRKMSPQ